MPTQAIAELLTPRLSLRRWSDADREPFAAMNADPAVMEHFPAPLSRAESDAFVDRIIQRMREHGFGLWAVEVRATGQFIGFVGLNPVPDTLSFPHAGWEIGWRLARAAWGHGYATEGARAALDYAFGPAALPEVVSFTAATNVRSQAVMQRLGMRRDPSEDFDHPAVPEGHPVRPHVLYRLPASDWPTSVDASE